MKTVRYKAPGSIGNLGVVESKDPGIPGPNEVRVGIHGSSLNGHDLNVAKGILPVEDGRILMSDGAGIVEAVGPGVSEFTVGDHVVSTFFPDWQRGDAPRAGFDRTPGMASTAMRSRRSFDQLISSLACRTVGLSPKRQHSPPLA